MAGAHAVQMVSVAAAPRPGALSRMRDELARWLEEHEYDSLRQMQGSMSSGRGASPAAFERVNTCGSCRAGPRARTPAPEGAIMRTVEVFTALPEGRTIPDEGTIVRCPSCGRDGLLQESPSAAHAVSMPRRRPSRATACSSSPPTAARLRPCDSIALREDAARAADT